MSRDSLLEIEKLPETVLAVGATLQQAGIRYSVVGSFAVYLQVESAEYHAGRLTGCADLIVDRDLPSDRLAVVLNGWRTATKEDGWITVGKGDEVPRVRLRTFELLETVRLPPGIEVTPVEHLLQHDLASYRMKERVHVQDLDSVGLITPEIEASLSDVLRARLAEVRATE